MSLAEPLSGQMLPDDASECMACSFLTTLYMQYNIKRLSESPFQYPCLLVNCASMLILS